MFRLTSIDDCIARPDKDGQSFPLVAHLKGVAERASANITDEHTVILFQLAGLCHDLAKADQRWQMYIRKKLEKGNPHAVPGAYLFSYFAFRYLKEKGKWNQRYRPLWFWLTRDLADHHGKLKNTHKMVKTDISCGKEDLLFLQLEGVRELIEQCLKFEISLHPEEIIAWKNKIGVHMDLISSTNLSSNNDAVAMNYLQQWRFYTSNLISADRFDIIEVEDDRFTPEDIFKTQSVLNNYLQEQQINSTKLNKTREEARHSIINQWQSAASSAFYQLDMPTGYGKTLTSLHLALEIMRTESLSKIIYVAPYLSILEQNAKVIMDALGINVLEHHSQAALTQISREELEKKEASEVKVDKQEEQEEDHNLVIESWAHRLVCTSFNQFADALIPKRAQHTLRRAFLKNSVIIIDEPQIFDVRYWNVFALAIQEAAKLYNLKVIYLSATMPPFLYDKPQILQVKGRSSQDRYTLLRVTESHQAASLAEWVIENKESTKLVILNTIQDAVEVFQALEDDKEHEHILVHGMMAPAHKKAVIAKIQAKLKGKEKHLIVVATQIIEAGVDVSFDAVFRANAILSSIIQAAGRLNRHLRTDKKCLYVFDFYRQKGNEQIDTRKFVYKDDVFVNKTDKLLSPGDSWSESELKELIYKYYRDSFKENSHQATMGAVHEAAEGRWESLDKFAPFQEDCQRLPLFVPWSWHKYKPYLQEEFHPLRGLFGAMNDFRFANADDIYDFFEKRKWINLSFQQKKRFLSIFFMFVVQIPARKALMYASKDDYLEKNVPKLKDMEQYHNEFGFPVISIDGFDSFI